MFSLLRRRTRSPPDRWHRNTPLLTFGKKDVIDIGNAYEGIGILGSVGSGKTSGSGFYLCKSMLELGFGGLVLCAKVDEADRWRRLCELTGRSQDLIVFSDSSGHEFNFLDYQLTFTNRIGGVTENLVNLLDETVEISERLSGSKPGSGQEAFWKQGIRRHGRNTIDLLVLGTGQVCIEHMLEIMRSVPRTLAQAQDSTWQSDSVLCMLLEQAKTRNAGNERALYDLEQVEQYFLNEFPCVAEKTRSVFEAGLLGVLDLFARGQLHWLFGRSTTVTPAACLDGKVIVIDLPVKSHMAIGLLAAAIWKRSFQQTLEQRRADQERPCFLVADEFQNFISSEDMRFAATARSSKCVNLWLTQSIPNLYTALGSDEAGRAAVDAVLGLVNLKLFHSNACPVTNEWAAELIGRRKMRTRSSSVNHAPNRFFNLFEEEQGSTSSLSESFEYPVLPWEFTALAKGGPPHMTTEAILFGGGRAWHGTGETYMRVNFKQGF